MPTTGTRVVAATCRGPLSPPMKRAARRDQGPQLGEVEVVAVDHRLGPRAEPRPGGVPDAAGRGGIRRSRHHHEAPGPVRCGQRRGQIDETLLGPTAKPVARTDVEYDDLVFVADAGRGKTSTDPSDRGRVSGISTGSSYGSGGFAKGSPSAASKSH